MRGESPLVSGFDEGWHEAGVTHSTAQHSTARGVAKQSRATPDALSKSFANTACAMPHLAYLASGPICLRSQVLAAEWTFMSNSYALDLDLTRTGNLWGISHAHLGPTPSANEVAIFPLPAKAHKDGRTRCCSNAMCMLNDPVGDPSSPAHAAGCPGAGGDNCEVVQVLALAVPLRWLRGWQQRERQGQQGQQGGASGPGPFAASGGGGGGSCGGGSGGVTRRDAPRRAASVGAAAPGQHRRAGVGRGGEEGEEEEERTGPGTLAGGWVFPFMVTTQQVTPGQDFW